MITAPRCLRTGQRISPPQRRITPAITIAVILAGLLATNSPAAPRTSNPGPLPQRSASTLRIQSGSYVGDESLAHAIVGLEFQPDVVLIKSDHSKSAVLRSASMTGDAAKILADNSALQAGLINSLDAAGFTIGNDDHVNKLDIDYYWTALAGDPQSLVTGTYVGNGVDDRSITGIGFEPAYLIVASAGGEAPMQRYPTQSGDSSLPFEASDPKPDRIQAIESDGFQIGKHNSVNEDGETFHFIAIAPVPGRVDGGLYLGDELSPRDLTGIGLRPDFLFVTRQENGSPTVLRGRSQPLDLTLPADNNAGFTEGIIQFLPDGFRVGADDTVNKGAEAYHWLALRDVFLVDLSITKTVDVPNPNEDDTIVWTVLVNNAGPDAATDVIVTDSLPAGVSYVSATPSQGGYNDLSGLWTVGTIAANATASLSITTKVDPGTAGATIINEATASGSDEIDVDPLNDTDSAGITVQSADLSVSKSVDNPSPNATDAIRYTITLNNAGPDDATGVQLTDLLPAGVSYTSDTPSQGSYDDVTGIWTVGSILASGTATLSIDATVDPGTGGSTILNSADISAADQGDLDPLNDTDNASINVQSADLGVDKTVDNPSPNEADPIRYTITLNNTGPDLATGVQLTDLLPAGVSYTGDTPSQGSYDDVTGIWDAGNLAMGATATLLLDATVDLGTAGATITNTATITASDQADPTLSNNFSSADIGSQSADLRVIKIVDVPNPNIGQAVRYTMTVTNGGPDDATGVQLTDLLPAGVSYTGDTPSQGSYDDVTGVWDVGSILMGGNAFLALDVTVNPGTAGATITNTATITASDQADPTGADNSSSVPLAVLGADLEISKIVDDASPNIGQTIRYTVTITNHGPDPATAIGVLDLLPSGVSLTAAVPSQGSYASGVGQWTVGSLGVGASAQLDLDASVDPGTLGSTIINTAAISGADQGDPNPLNDDDSASITVQSADLSVNKSVDDPSPNETDPIRYTITLNNSGPDDATGIQLTDLLPTGVSYTADTPSQGSYDDVAGIWAVGSLATGATAALVLDATVDLGTGGSTITNDVSITSADQADPNAADNSSSVFLTVLGADLEISKIVDNANPNVGQTIRYTVTATNHGPDPATGVQLTDLLPSGVSYTGDTPSQGSYASGVGQWTVGSLGVGASAQLDLDASVDPGTLGSTIINTAAISGADQGDPNPLNDDDSASITVQSADLSVNKSVDDPSPNEADPIRYTITLNNSGPDDATGIQLTDLLPTGVSYTTDTPSQGSYDDGTGIWNVGSLATGATATLLLDATVDLGTGGSTITNSASITAADQADPNASNNSSAAAIGSQSADLRVIKIVDVANPNVGEAIRYTVTITNDGPDDATGVQLTDLLPAGVSYVTDTPSQGSYDDVTGIWNVGSILMGGSASITLDATIAPGTAGATITNTASITALDQADPNGTDNLSSAPLTVQSPPANALAAVVYPQSGATLRPGAAPAELFRFDLRNDGTEDQTLENVRLEDTTIGPGTTEELDESWSFLQLKLQSDPAILSATNMVGAQAEFSGLSLAIPPGETRTLIVLGGASLFARDGDRLDLQLRDETRFSFSGPVILDADWPLAPTDSFPIDGMVNAQIGVVDDLPEVLLSGQTENLALHLVIPANGYQPDRLQRINLVNLGSALPDIHIAAMRGRVDNGDAAFDPGTDPTLGDFVFTGDRWELTGLDVSVPPEGMHLFVAIDLAATVAPGEPLLAGQTVRLAVPTLPDVGLGMESDNDGPIDVLTPASLTQTIGTADQITLAPGTLSAITVHPGDEVLLLDVLASNTYTVPHRLESLRVQNGTLGPGVQSELDSEIEVLLLVEDSNDNGLYDGLETDLLLRTTLFEDGLAEFDGLIWNVPDDATRHLFVLARVSGHAAADGDLLGAFIGDARDVVFADEPTVAAIWPVGSGSVHTIDGMIADQIDNMGTPAATLGPSEGPALALDFRVGPNGYRGDLLEGVRVENLGSAMVSDIAELRLWRDGGNGQFDIGATDDEDLGPLIWIDDGWQSTLLSSPLNAGGARLFVGLTAGASPGDSTTVQLSIPTGGINVSSENDGPIDVAVNNPETQLLSSAPLLVETGLVRRSSTLGQLISARMVVRNLGAESIENILPSALDATNAGVLAQLSGPTPAQFDLAVGAADTFEWSYQAVGTGATRLAGFASGVGQLSGLARHSLSSQSPEHGVFVEADSLDLNPIASAPFSVNRGQTNVVPLSLTFGNGGIEGSSSVNVLAVRVRIENDSGQGIVPTELFSEVVVHEGTREYLRRAVTESSGATMDLVLATPIEVAIQQPVTVNLKLSIDPATLIPAFRVVILDESWITAEDATSSAPVVVQVTAGGGGYPIASGLASVWDEATVLDATRIIAGESRIGRGQTDVDLLTFDLESPGVDGVTADVRLREFTVALSDTNGALHEDPSRYLDRLHIRADAQWIADVLVSSITDTVITIVLEPPLTLEVNSPRRIVIAGSVSELAPLDAFKLRLADERDVSAWDANTVGPVPANFDPVPLESAAHRIESPAESLLVVATPRIPTTIALGESDIETMQLELRHPGGPSTARIRCDSLTLRAQDASRTPVALGDYLSRVGLYQGITALGDPLEPPAGSTTVTLPLTGLLLSPGQSALLSLRANIELSAPLTTLEIYVSSTGVRCVDANTTIPVRIDPAAGSDFPLASGLTRVSQPPQELGIGLNSRIPALLVPGVPNVPIARLTLVSDGAPGEADIQIASLRLRAQDRADAALPMGEVITRVACSRAGDLLSEAVDPGADSTIVQLQFVPPIRIAPGEPVILELEMDLASANSTEGFRIRVEEADVGIVQPDNTLLTMRATPLNGGSFPLRTDEANFSPAALQESFTNFPNPFAAGREDTSIAFYLPFDARVTVEVFSITGDRVARLLDGQSLTAGLHEFLRWDGRNGQGRVVRNGVYLLRLEFEGDQSGDLLRKVAVVR